MTRNANAELLRLATRCARRGLAVTSLQVHTPDERTWAIDPVRSGGFRLFEIDLECRRGPDEHHAVEGDTWDMGDLLDYLDAVGRPKTPPHRSGLSGADSPSDPTT